MVSQKKWDRFLFITIHPPPTYTAIMNQLSIDFYILHLRVLMMRLKNKSHFSSSHLVLVDVCLVTELPPHYLLSEQVTDRLLEVD